MAYTHILTEDCPDCDGEGTIWGYEGRITNNSPWAGTWEMECPYCDGRGELYTETIKEDPMNEVDFICFNMEQDRLERQREVQIKKSHQEQNF